MLKAPRSAYLEYLDWLESAGEHRCLPTARRIIAEMEQVASEPIDTRDIGLDDRGHWHAPDPAPTATRCAEPLLPAMATF